MTPRAPSSINSGSWSRICFIKQINCLIVNVICFVQCFRFYKVDFIFLLIFFILF